MTEIFEFPVAKGQTEATAPPVNAGERRRLADLRFTDEIATMSRRCFGLEAAIHGATDWGCDERHGVLHLANDLANGMTRLADAFEAERQLRIGEERQ